MSLQSGLTPFREDTPEPERARQTVPLQDPAIHAPGLAPTAAPVSTFNRALSVPQDDRADRLAAALSGINPSLQRFAQTMAEESKDDTQARVQAKILKAGSTAEVEKLIANDPEMRDGLGKAAASRRLGQLLAADAINEAKTRFQNGFDRVNGDMGQLTSEVMKPYLDRYKDDAIFTRQFTDDVTPGIAALRNADAQAKSQDAYNRTQDDQSKIFLGIAERGLDAGKAPAAIAADLTREFYGNEKILRLPYADQQKALVPVVSALAEKGRYDLVKAIGEQERDGGRLMDNASVGSAIAQAMTRARSVRDRETKDATIDRRQTDYDLFHNGKASPEDEARVLAEARKHDGSMDESTANAWVQTNRNVRERQQEEARKEAEKAKLLDRLNSQEAKLASMGVEAMRSGKVFSLPQVIILNKKGEEETLTPDKFRERAGEDYEKWSTQRAQQTGETWDQTVLREIPAFTSNGYVPKKWKDTITAGGNSISAAVTTGSGELPEAAQRGYALYKLLRANNVQMLGDLVPKDQRDFYEAWRVGEEETGVTPQKALGVANEFHSDPAARLKRASSPTMRAIKDRVASLGSTFGSLFGGQPAPENIGDMAATISRTAEFYGALGMGADAAVKAAVKRLQETHVSINGHWVDASDRRLPPDFPALAGDMLAQYAAKHGKTEGLSASDLTVRSVGGGDTWRIVRRSDGIPVDDGTDSVFRTGDLQRARNLREEARIEGTLKRMRENTRKPRVAPAAAELTGP